MGRSDIVGRNPTSRGSGFQSCRSDRRQSHRWHQALWAALRHLSRHGEGGSICLAGRKGPISEASTTGVRGCGRRSRSFLFLEDQAWHPVDRYAFMEADAYRSADLEPCFVPQAHGQASACRRTGVAKCRELILGGPRGLLANRNALAAHFLQKSRWCELPHRRGASTTVKSAWSFSRPL